MTNPRRIARAVALLWLCACQEGPTQTHVVLEVRVAKALAARVTRIEVHSQKPGGLRDAGASRSAAYTAGDALHFVLRPATGRSELQVRIVALHDREPLASAVLRSHYEKARGLYLTVELSCEGERDLGEQRASESPRGAIDSCRYDVRRQNGAAGAGGRAGGGASGMTAGMGGADAGSGGRRAGGSSGTGAGEGGMAGAGVGGAGAGGAGAGGAGAGGAGAGGAGAGGAGAGGAGMMAGSGSSAPGCYSWRTVAKIADVETLMPEAFVAGVEERENPAEQVKQYICLATPVGMTAKSIGKASKWGCYVPGSGTSAYTVETNVEILISRNTQPCLRWAPLAAEKAPTSTLAFGSPAKVRVCRVFHEEIGEGRNTKGPRVGQVRQENGQWVCRYEFYSYLGNPTHTNQPGEVTEVLE